MIVGRCTADGWMDGCKRQIHPVTFPKNRSMIGASRIGLSFRKVLEVEDSLQSKGKHLLMIHTMIVSDP